MARELSRVFGKGVGFTVGLIFLPFILTTEELNSNYSQSHTNTKVNHPRLISLKNENIYHFIVVLFTKPNIYVQFLLCDSVDLSEKLKDFKQCIHTVIVGKIKTES